MNKNKIINSWFADLYDQLETQTDDVEFLLSIIGKKPKNILEVCCGSGRILVPLARVGHYVTGFDISEDMMSKIPDKANGLSNLQFYKADAVNSVWGSDFDIIVLAGNILINIESDMDYKKAQQLFIKKAANSLKIGGYIYLDFNLLAKPEQFFGQKQERIIFEGIDSNGVYGKYIVFGGTFDTATQICRGRNRTELVTREGEEIIVEKEAIKHIPTLYDVHEWLANAGFSVELEYGDYSGNPVGENTYRAIIYAKKIDGRIICLMI